LKKAFFIKVSHVGPLQGAEVLHVASAQGATLFKQGKNKEIREVSRKRSFEDEFSFDWFGSHLYS
jgi:hypothetical protein